VSTPAPGAEDVEFDNKGYVYSGLSDGSIIRFKGNGSDVEVVAKSEGAIFGIDINSKFDKLVLADQKTGIKVLDLNTRKF
jgi:tricorn protease-like protein